VMNVVAFALRPIATPDQPQAEVRHIERAWKASGARGQDSSSHGWMDAPGIEPPVERETGRTADADPPSKQLAAELAAVAPAAHSFGRRGR